MKGREFERGDGYNGVKVNYWALSQSAAWKREIKEAEKRKIWRSTEAVVNTVGNHSGST